MEIVEINKRTLLKYLEHCQQVCQQSREHALKEEWEQIKKQVNQKEGK